MDFSGGSGVSGGRGSSCSAPAPNFPHAQQLRQVCPTSTNVRPIDGKAARYWTQRGTCCLIAFCCCCCYPASVFRLALFRACHCKFLPCESGQRPWAGLKFFGPLTPPLCTDIRRLQGFMFKKEKSLHEPDCLSRYSNFGPRFLSVNNLIDRCVYFHAPGSFQGYLLQN